MLKTHFLFLSGYMAPEYALYGYLTQKADVYSFGVMALEIVAGKNNMQYRPSEEFVCLLDWVRNQIHPKLRNKQSHGYFWLFCV